MIPAEARRIIDTLESVKHDKDLVLDAIECLDLMHHKRQRSVRDQARIDKATTWVMEITNV